ncbi:hypothetical protein Tco_0219739 [Tanacetum coccineum]
MKGVVEYENEELEILTDAQLLLDFKKTCKDSLYSDRTLNATRLDVANEGDEDDASNFTILDNISRYLNKNPAPSLEDVGLPRIAGTSGLNSHDGIFGKENPIGDYVDPYCKNLIVGFIDRFAYLGYHNIDHAAE